MTNRRDTDDGGVPWHTRQVTEGMRQCWDALYEFDRRQMQAAINDENPHGHPEVNEAKIALHASVMNQFRLLREQIKEHLSPDYWRDVDVYRDPDTGEVLIRGLGSLEDWQVRVYQTERTPDRAGEVNPDAETHWDAQLLPPRAYNRIVNLLAGCATHLGYFEAPNPPRGAHQAEAYPDMGPGYEEPPEDFEEQADDDEVWAPTPAVRRAVENSDSEVSAFGD